MGPKSPLGGSNPERKPRKPACQNLAILIDALCHPDCRAETRLVYAEAITMELLCSALESLETLSTQSACQHSDRELRCLHAARSLLTQQFSPAPTLRQVARCVGLNETTLKRGFKSVYGETPFEFSVKCRMEHALTLLQNREIQVLSVAKAVGYRHQASFATAFRRHFGLRPREVRRGASAVLPDLQKCIA